MNKKRLIISSVISIVCVAILLIGSTYSIFTTTEIDDTSNVYTTGNLVVNYKIGTGSVAFTDVTPRNEEEADSVFPYRLNVTNNGNVPYMFNVILTDTTSSSSNTIDYQYIMTKVGYLESKSLSECENNVIKEGVILLAGESVDIDVRVWISDEIQNSEMGKSFYAKLSIDGLAVYDDNTEINNDMLSLRYMNGTSTSDFKSETYLTYIKNASFVDYIDTSNAVEYWDFTSTDAVNKNKVIAWVEDNGTTDANGNKYYNLYIGSKEKIYVKKLQTFFQNMTSLENISFDNLDTSLTNNMLWVFGGCKSLINLDLSSFDTSNVTSFYYMFNGCTGLTNLNVSSFDTSNATDMTNMFSGCSSLTELDVSNFDTSNVTKMVRMFGECYSLTSLDVSGFDTSNVTSMKNMFYRCDSLIELDLSGWDTSNVTNMASMFSRSGLAILDLSGWDTSNVTDMNSMFYYCYNLTTTITIMSTSATTYTNMFLYAATTKDSENNYIGKIIVNYTSTTSELVDSMIATGTGNVVKGELV